jgi:enoyl-CoA hydratase/carnithine racemase
MIKTYRAPGNDAVAVLSINRPAQRNAFTGTVISDLIAAIAELRDDVSVRAVVITGEGGFFSAGADLSLFDEIGEVADINIVTRTLARGGRLCRDVETLPQPTIAAIEGGAVGGGLSLAVSCDWRVMADNAFAYVPEAMLGLNYGWNTLPRLNRLIGPARAKTLSILCRRHSAVECEKWGLADQLSEPGKALETALALADEVCALPRLAVQMIKKSANAHATAIAESASFSDMDMMLVCMTDPEGTAAREALKKSRERRK